MIHHHHSSLASTLILFAPLSLHCTGKFSCLIKSNFLSILCLHPCNWMCWRRTHIHTGWSHSKCLVIITSCGLVILPSYHSVTLSNPSPILLKNSSLLSSILHSLLTYHSLASYFTKKLETSKNISTSYHHISPSTSIRAHMLCFSSWDSEWIIGALSQGQPPLVYWIPSPLNATRLFL